MAVNLSDAEVSCLKILAALYEANDFYWSIEKGLESLGLTPQNYQPVLSMLQQYGYIDNVAHTTDGWFTMFSIHASSVQTVREFELEKKKLDNKDIV